jgi:hypothetical protein
MTDDNESKSDKTVWLKVGIPESLRNQFKSKVSAKGQTMNEVVIDYVKKYVEEEENKESKK